MIEDPALLRQIISDLREDYPTRDTLLDRAALAALTGLCASERRWDEVDEEELTARYRRVAVDAYGIAVEFLEEREHRLSGGGDGTG